MDVDESHVHAPPIPRIAGGSPVANVVTTLGREFPLAEAEVSWLDVPARLVLPFVGRSRLYRREQHGRARISWRTRALHWRTRNHGSARHGAASGLG